MCKTYEKKKTENGHEKEPSQTLPARLSVFTFIWSHIALLQCIKLYNTPGLSSLDTGLACSLLLTMVIAFIQPNKRYALLALCSTHTISLLFQGSQSNHVIVALIINLGIILNYSHDVLLWSSQVASTFYLTLIFLYWIPCLHKLNNDWFNPQVSCASLFTSSVLSSFVKEHTWFTRTLITTAPHQAVALELLLPIVLILARYAPSPSVRESSFIVFILLASCFHLILALPLPPMSVYPFSAVMYPLLILLVSDDNLSKAVQSITKRAWIIPLFIGIAGYLLNTGSKLLLEPGETLFEYPPYEIWSSSIVWTFLIILFFIIALTTSTRKASAVSHADFHRFTMAGVLVTSGIVFVGLTPYLGIRDYPALAMFSNLRTEGVFPNHLFPTAQYMTVTKYRESTVKVLETNAHSLRYFQVNLADFFVKRVRDFNDKIDIRNEFWIAPPKWKPVPTKTSAFVPYSVPMVEIRRHVAKALSLKESLYFKFSLNRGEPLVFNSSIAFAGVGEDLYRELATPLTWFESKLIRFRSFDDNNSPCRH